MKPSIVVSSQDPAGINIRDVLVELQGFTDSGTIFNTFPVYSKEGINLYTIKERTIDAEHVDEDIDGDFIIFVTKHQAESGKKCLCVHTPGNWAKAEVGGKDKTLCTAMPAMMKSALKKILSIYDGDEFDITMECTHHGPELKKPCLFIEIGSTEEEWSRKDLGKIMANVVNFLIMNPPTKKKGVVVIGGGHYNQVATKVMLKTDYAVGHVCPKHLLSVLDEEMLRQAIEKNGNNFEMVILDWKGLGSEKQRIMDIIGSLGLNHERYQKMIHEE
ncbi:hypothetical protein HQ545_07270 [Candidatus Woesearchaeota archaeon]|nr:hypothetical protein [Candidatus Woesearchaeota archaeon]